VSRVDYSEPAGYDSDTPQGDSVTPDASHDQIEVTTDDQECSAATNETDLYTAHLPTQPPILCGTGPNHSDDQ